MRGWPRPRQPRIDDLSLMVGAGLKPTPTGDTRWAAGDSRHITYGSIARVSSREPT